MPTRNQIPKMLLQGIPVGLGQLYSISHRHTAMLSCKLDNLQRQLRQRGQHNFFALDFFLKPAYQFGQ